MRPTDRLGGLKVVEWKNPSLGESIDIEKVRNAYISARENAAEESIFRQLRLNQWVKQSTRWMQMDKWDACAFPVNEEELIGRTCYGGLDLSSTLDITVFVLVFPLRNDEEKELMKLTLEERIAHGGHKVLRWMMDNVYVRQDTAGNIKMDKEKSTEKIDAAVATVMALDRAIRNQAAREVYMMAGEFLFFKKENLSGRWRGLNDHGFVYVSE